MKVLHYRYATLLWYPVLVSIQVPLAYQASALPIELTGHKLAGPERFELPTAGFEDQNSSAELRTDCMAGLDRN